jgi:hypothetical protein
MHSQQGSEIHCQLQFASYCHAPARSTRGSSRCERLGAIEHHAMLPGRPSSVDALSWLTATIKQQDLVARQRWSCVSNRNRFLQPGIWGQGLRLDPGGSRISSAKETYDAFFILTNYHETLHGPRRSRIATTTTTTLRKR